MSAASSISSTYCGGNDALSCSINERTTPSFWPASPRAADSSALNCSTVFTTAGASTGGATGTSTFGGATGTATGGAGTGTGGAFSIGTVGNGAFASSAASGANIWRITSPYCTP